MKKAMITGVTGQDGSYLAEFLLEKGYEVHGMVRRTSSVNDRRISHLHDKLIMHYGDLQDACNINKLVSEIQPDEIYNLAAQSDVAVSFEMPEYTADVDALGTLRILEAIRANRLEEKTRFYQASTSELFGKVQETPQTEKTQFYPRSPYAVAKLYAYWITVNYRESYGLYSCNGVLFNHESPRRGESFVTRKITLGLANVLLGNQDCVFLGNLDSKRDWGHARDYVRMQWMMLQQEEAKDYVIATGEQYTIRQFIIWAADALGICVEFQGNGLDEVVKIVDIQNESITAVKKGDVIFRVSEKFYRPAEVDTLLGDASKAKRDLGWVPEVSTKSMCQEMAKSDFLQLLSKTGNE